MKNTISFWMAGRLSAVDVKFFAIFLGLIFIILPPFAGMGLAAGILHYQVDSSQPGTKSLVVRIEADSFPPGPLTFKLPVLHSRKRGSVALRNFTFSSGATENTHLKTENGSLLVEVPLSGAFVLSYQFIPATQTVCLEDSISEAGFCFLRARQFVLSTDEDCDADIEFKLPAGWKAYLQTPPFMGRQFEVLPEADQGFYLSPCSFEKRSWNGLDMLCLFQETSKSQVDPILDVLKRQSGYLLGTGRIKKNKSLLLLFSRPVKGIPAEICSPALGLIAIPVGNKAENSESLPVAMQQKLATTLCQALYPQLAGNSNREESQKLASYLSWKLMLKDNRISPEEFLETITEGGRAGTASTGLPLSRSDSAPNGMNQDDLLIHVEGITRYFLMDLWLESFGRDSKSLSDLLTKSNSVNLEKKTALLPWQIQFRKERRVGRFEEQLFSGQLVSAKDLLRPFGLVFLERLIPRFEFQLSETGAVEKSEDGGNGLLHLGDRLLAVNTYPIHVCFDLIRARCFLAPNQMVNLTVERNGTILNLNYRMGLERYARFELNRLSDMDKLERMVRFLGKGKSEP
jgi:hypothetical protein